MAVGVIDVNILIDYKDDSGSILVVASEPSSWQTA